MNFLASLAPALIAAITGNGKTTVEASASASTDVTVNPQITSINVIDTEPLADALTLINASAEKVGVAVKNAQEDFAYQLRLIAAGLALFFVARKVWK